MPTSSDSNYLRLEASPSVLREDGIEYGFIGKLQGLKYEYRPDITNHFKEVQRLKIQLDQYTDLTEENKAAIEQVLPEEHHRGFKGAYLETAQRLKERLGKGKGDDQPKPDNVDQLDFEFVLFASAVIDYDYIMGLIARFSAKGPGKSKMSREALIGLIQSDAKFMNEREDIAAYIGTLKAGEGLSEKAIRDSYTRFKAKKNAQELAAIAQKHGLAAAALQAFVDAILDRMIFDGEQFGDLMAPSTSAGKPVPRLNSPSWKTCIHC